MSEPQVITGAAALRERKARRRRLAKLLALALSTGLALVVGEVAVRALAPQTSGLDRIYVNDPDTGYRMVPGSHPAGYPIDINSQGLRDVERPVAKPAGARRVVVLGDSFTFAALPVEQGYCRQLGARLGGVDVVNAGVPGWTTWQEAAWLKRDGLAYGPDVVVVGVFIGNDVEENLRRGQPPEEREERGLLRRLTNSSHLYRLFKGLPEDLWYRAQGDSSRARRYHKIERRRLAVFDRGAAAAAFEPGWTVLKEELGKIVALVAPRPVVALLIPDELQVDPALVQAVCARDGSDPAAFDLDAPQARLAKLCADVGAAVVDTLPELRRRTAAGERLYIPLDSHWNEAGNALAADALARQPALAGLVTR